MLLRAFKALAITVRQEQEGGIHIVKESRTLCVCDVVMSVGSPQESASPLLIKGFCKIIRHKINTQE